MVDVGDTYRGGKVAAIQGNTIFVNREGHTIKYVTPEFAEYARATGPAPVRRTEAIASGQIQQGYNRTPVVSQRNTPQVIDVRGSGKITYETPEQVEARLAYLKGEKSYVERVTSTGTPIFTKEEPKDTTLGEATIREQQRLAEKYGPTYQTTETGKRNIQENIVRYGFGASPMVRAAEDLRRAGASERTIARQKALEDIKRARYQYYAGPRPSHGDPYGIKAGMASDPNYFERNKAVGGVHYPGKWGGGEYAVRQQEAANRGYTGYMKTEFGGGMGGEGVAERRNIIYDVDEQGRPLSVSGIPVVERGFDTLFEQAAQRAEMGRTNMPIRKYDFKVKGDVPQRELEKIPEGVEVSIPEGSTMKEGSFKWSPETQSYVWDRTLTPAEFRAQYPNEIFRQSKEGQKVQFPEPGLVTKEEKQIVKSEFPVTSFGGQFSSYSGADLAIPEGFKISSFVEEGGKIVYTMVPDMAEYDAGTQRTIESFKTVTPWAPFVGDIINRFKMPVIENITSAMRNAEVQRRVGMAEAKTDEEKKQVQAKYEKEIQYIKNTTGAKVTVEDTITPEKQGLRYSPLIYGDILMRAVHGDIPFVDIELSPAASGALYIGGGIAATAVPALKAPSVLAKGWAAATGAAEYGGFTVVQEEATKIGVPTGISFALGLGAAKGIGTVSKATREVVASRAPISGGLPVNPERVLQRGIETELYNRGNIAEASSRTRATYVGYGTSIKDIAKAVLKKEPAKTQYAPKISVAAGELKITKPYVQSIGGSLPVNRVFTDVFGYQKISSVTPGRFSQMKTEMRGFSGSLRAGENIWSRRLEPSEVGAYKVKEIELPKLEKGSVGSGSSIGTVKEIAGQKHVATYYVDGKLVTKSVSGVVKEKTFADVSVDMGRDYSNLYMDFERNFGGLYEKPKIKLIKSFESSSKKLGEYNPVTNEIYLYEKNIGDIAKKLGKSKKDIYRDVILHELKHAKDTQRGIDMMHPYSTDAGYGLQEIRATSAEKGAFRKLTKESVSKDVYEYATKTTDKVFDIIKKKHGGKEVFGKVIERPAPLYKSVGVNLKSILNYYRMRGTITSETFGGRRLPRQLFEMSVGKSTEFNLDKTKSSGVVRASGRIMEYGTDKRGFAKPGRTRVNFLIDEKYVEKFITKKSASERTSGGVQESVSGGGGGRTRQVTQIRMQDIGRNKLMQQYVTQQVGEIATAAESARYTRVGQRTMFGIGRTPRSTSIDQILLQRTGPNRQQLISKQEMEGQLPKIGADAGIDNRQIMRQIQKINQEISRQIPRQGIEVGTIQQSAKKLKHEQKLDKGLGPIEDMDFRIPKTPFTPPTFPGGDIPIWGKGSVPAGGGGSKKYASPKGKRRTLRYNPIASGQDIIKKWATRR